MTTINKEKLQQLKNEIKEVSAEIRNLKKNYKAEQRKESAFESVSNIPTFPYLVKNSFDYKPLWNIQDSLHSQKLYIRQRYIAYALLKGRKYEQIESRVREGNEPNWKIIKGIQDECFN